METLFEDVASVMSLMDQYGAGELVNANRVFEELEACRLQDDRVNHVATNLLSDLGIRRRESDSPEILIVPSENSIDRINDAQSALQDSVIANHPNGSNSDVADKSVMVTASVIGVVPESSSTELAETASRPELISPSLVQEFQEEMSNSQVGGDLLEPQTSTFTSEVSCLELEESGPIPITSTQSWTSFRPVKGYDSGNSSPDDPVVQCTFRLNEKMPSPKTPDSTEFAASSPSKRNQASSRSPRKKARLNGDEAKPSVNEQNSEVSIKGVPSNKAAQFVAALSDMFPEADPQYLWQKCEEIENEAQLNDEIVKMITSNDYPHINSWQYTKDVPNRVPVSAAAGCAADLANFSAPGTSGSNQMAKPVDVEEAALPFAPVIKMSSSPAAPTVGILGKPHRSMQGPLNPVKIDKGETSCNGSHGDNTPTISGSSKKNELVKVKSLNELKEKLIDVNENHDVAGPSGLNKPPSTPREPWQDKLDNFIQILPEADPSYLEEKARALYDKDEESQQFVLHALEMKDFPTRKDWQWRQDQLALQKKYTEEFSIQDFLEMFPDPFTFFREGKRQCDKSLGTMYLRNKYRKLRVADISAAFSANNYNLTSTCRRLDNWTGSFMKSRRCQVGYDVKKDGDKGIDLQFLQEVAFIENESKIVEFLNAKKEKRETAFKEAKEKGELLECQCCYDGEVLLEDVRTCEEGHLFCLECVRKSSEQRIGEGKTTFPCLADCTAEFKLKTVQEVLKPVAFSRLVQRKQAEEVKAAGIDELVQCPFCDFCNLLPPADKVFKCLNPDCLKRSCRDCKEEDHVPLRCEEVEKSSEVKMRTYIEDQMTAALVRTCWKCSRKFVKEDGCNKMTCQCGALMCYVCRQPVKDYSHFNGQGGDAFDKCPLYSDHRALEAEEVKKVAEKAKRDALAMKPNVKLKHDPTKLLPVYKPKTTQPHYPHDYHNYEYDYDDDELGSEEEEEEEAMHYFRRYGDEEMEEEEEEEEVEEEEETETDDSDVDSEDTPQY